MDKIEFAKNQVIIVQDKLFKCQENRRNLMQNANLLNEELKEIYNELIQIKREDPKYVKLTILENKVLQKQIKVGNQLKFLEGEEKDYFTELAISIKEYQESQIIFTQRYKYLSILASALLAILSLISSIVYNNKKIQNIVHVINEAEHSIESNFNDKVEVIIETIELHEKKLALNYSHKVNEVGILKLENNGHENFKTEIAMLTNVEKIKIISFFLSLTGFTFYILQQTFKS